MTLPPLEEEGYASSDDDPDGHTREDVEPLGWRDRGDRGAELGVLRLLPPSCSSCADDASSAKGGANGALDSKSMTSAFTPKDLCFVTHERKTTRHTRGKVQNDGMP